MKGIEYNKWINEVKNILDDFVIKKINPICPNAVDFYSERYFMLYYFFGIPNIGDFNIRIKTYKKAKTLCEPIVEILRIAIEFNSKPNITEEMLKKYNLIPLIKHSNTIDSYDLISMDYHVNIVLMPQLKSFLTMLAEIINQKK